MGERKVFGSWSFSAMLDKALAVVNRGAWKLEAFPGQGSEARVTHVTERLPNGGIEIRDVLHYGTLTRKQVRDEWTNVVLVTSLGFTDCHNGPNEAFPEFGECLADTSRRASERERTGAPDKGWMTLDGVRAAFKDWTILDGMRAAFKEETKSEQSPKAAPVLTAAEAYKVLHVAATDPAADRFWTVVHAVKGECILTLHGKEMCFVDLYGFLQQQKPTDKTLPFRIYLTADGYHVAESAELAGKAYPTLSECLAAHDMSRCEGSESPPVLNRSDVERLLAEVETMGKVAAPTFWTAQRAGEFATLPESCGFYFRGRMVRPWLYGSLCNAAWETNGAPWKVLMASRGFYSIKEPGARPAGPYRTFECGAAFLQENTEPNRCFPPPTAVKVRECAPVLTQTEADKVLSEIQAIREDGLTTFWTPLRCPASQRVLIKGAAEGVRVFGVLEKTGAVEAGAPWRIYMTPFGFSALAAPTDEACEPAHATYPACMTAFRDAHYSKEQAQDTVNPSPTGRTPATGATFQVFVKTDTGAPIVLGGGPVGFRPAPVIFSSEHCRAVLDSFRKEAGHVVTVSRTNYVGSTDLPAGAFCEGRIKLPEPTEGNYVSHVWVTTAGYYARTYNANDIAGPFPSVDLAKGGAINAAVKRMDAVRHDPRSMRDPDGVRCRCDKPHRVMGVRVFKDGDQWCALYGQNIQEGCAGFGRTRASACESFDDNWRRFPINGYVGKLEWTGPSTNITVHTGKLRVSLDADGVRGWGEDLGSARAGFIVAWRRRKNEDLASAVKDLGRTDVYTAEARKRDMDFVQAREDFADKIGRAYGLPPYLIGGFSMSATVACVLDGDQRPVCLCDKPHRRLRPTVKQGVGVFTAEFGALQGDPFHATGTTQRAALDAFDKAVTDRAQGSIGGVLGSLRVYPYPTVRINGVGEVELDALMVAGGIQYAVFGVGKDFPTARDAFFASWGNQTAVATDMQKRVRDGVNAVDIQALYQWSRSAVQNTICLPHVPGNVRRIGVLTSRMETVTPRIIHATSVGFYTPGVPRAFPSIPSLIAECNRRDATMAPTGHTHGTAPEHTKTEHTKTEETRPMRPDTVQVHTDEIPPPKQPEDLHARVFYFKDLGKFYREDKVKITLAESVQWHTVCEYVRALCNPQRLPGLTPRADASGFTVLVLPPEGADYGFPAIVYKPARDVN